MIIQLAIIEITSLTKRYGDVTAVDDISLSIEEGEIFGFLGANGAGKSTTMMILTTLLKPTGGTALVAGYDVVSQAKAVRENIGYVQQDTAVDEFMSGRDNLAFTSRINRIPKDTAQKRIDDILSLVELEDRQNDQVVTYSGGMKKRLDIANGLLHKPRVLLLDEPTVGLDIQTRRRIWEHLRYVREEYGISIFVTTHYMDEADKLCDRVGIVDRGKIQSVGSPTEMKDALGSQVISLVMDGDSSARIVPTLQSMSEIRDVRQETDHVIAYTYGGDRIVPSIFNKADSLGIRINSISITPTTLDDVFLSYTGYDLHDEGDAQKKPPTGRRRKMV